GPGRPGPPGAADPARLRRQEPAHLPARVRPGPAHRGGRAGRGPGRRGQRRRRDGRRGDPGDRHPISAADPGPDAAPLALAPAADLPRTSDRPIKKLPTLRGRTVVNLFFEDSTRTRISFEAAAKRLSADVINFSAKGSSVAKGESLKDTALTLEAMGAD